VTAQADSKKVRQLTQQGNDATAVAKMEIAEQSKLIAEQSKLLEKVIESLEAVIRGVHTDTPRPPPYTENGPGRTGMHQGKGLESR